MPEKRTSVRIDALDDAAVKDAYALGCERLDALARALAAVSEEFIRTKEAAAAVAGYVLCSMILRQLGELDREIDSVIKKRGFEDSMGNADSDRFSGEAAEAPVSSYCWYCGAEIRFGERYFLHEEVRVCADCAKDYAYSVFERDARIKTAGEE